MVTRSEASRSSSSASSASNPELVRDDDRLYTDPALTAATPSDDPLVRFLGKHWRLLAAILAIYGIVWAGQFLYRESRLRRAEKGSEELARVKESYERLVTAQDALISAQRDQASADPAKGDSSKAGSGKEGASVEELSSKRAEARTALDERVRIVEDQGGLFADLGGLYYALGLTSIGEAGVAESVLAKGRAWKSTSPRAPERILAETRGYLAAKVKLATPETHQNGVGELTALAKEGAYLNAAAALALAAAATSDEDRASARETLKAVRASHPEQGDLIQEESKRIGFIVE